jgi:flavin reductase (DIM6/NTAB) family NADH-FMN oxidoreductase RutF
VKETFDALMGDLDYPMFVVTVERGGERSGCLVGFANQCSIDPPRFAVCLSKANRTYTLAVEADMLGVHVVPASEGTLAELFGGETGDDVDKFERCQWSPGPGNVPLLDRCPDRFVGRVLGRFDAGDHVAFVLEPLAAERSGAGSQFRFHRAKRIEPGHEP